MNCWNAFFLAELVADYFDLILNVSTNIMFQNIFPANVAVADVDVIVILLLLLFLLKLLLLLLWLQLLCTRIIFVLTTVATGCCFVVVRVAFSVII